MSTLRSSHPQLLAPRPRWLPTPPLAAVVLLLCLGLGTGLWLLFGREASTWCGKVAGPYVPDLEPCQVQLRRLGREVGVYRQRRHQFPASLEDFNPVPVCPWTGRPYAYHPEGYLYCAGRQHGERNAPAFDFTRDDAVASALPPPAGSAARAAWDSAELAVDRTLAFFAAYSAARYGEAYREASSFLASAGYGRPESGYAVLVAVRSAQLSGDAELVSGARALLREGLRKLPRVWPFPLVQAVNGEPVRVAPEGAEQEADVKAFRA